MQCKSRANNNVRTDNTVHTIFMIKIEYLLTFSNITSSCICWSYFLLDFLLQVMRRKVDEISRKLDILYDLIRQSRLSPDVLQGLHAIAQGKARYNKPHIYFNFLLQMFKV